MGVLTPIKTRTLTQTVINFAEDATFCELITGILLSMSHTAATLADLQNQINNFQDTYKTKVNSTDCPGFLVDKFQSSATVEMEVLPEVAGCRKIQFNVIPGDPGDPPTGLTDPCETPWTVITGYETFLATNAALNQVWQGNVSWSINKIGEIKLRGRAFLNNPFFIWTAIPNVLQAPALADQKIFELPNIPCIEDKIGATDDYYGDVLVSKINVGSTQYFAIVSLRRIGRAFWINIRQGPEAPSSVFDPALFVIPFGQLNAIS